MWALLFILGILNVKQDQICSNCSPKVVALKLLEFISRAGLSSVEHMKHVSFSSDIPKRISKWGASQCGYVVSTSASRQGDPG